MIGKGRYALSPSTPAATTTVMLSGVCTRVISAGPCRYHNMRTGSQQQQLQHRCSPSNVPALLWPPYLLLPPPPALEKGL